MLNRYSVKALDTLDGMWSVIYFNKVTKQIIISRDRLGIYTVKKDSKHLEVKQ